MMQERARNSAAAAAAWQLACMAAAGLRLQPL